VKILLLGDSVSWGDGVDDRDEIYPQRLERELQAKDTRRTVEIINSAVPGYSTFQQANLLERDAERLRPTAVVPNSA
jgi:lysophospholipase L1-like esterase